MTAKLRDSLEWLMMVAMIFGGGALAQAQQDAMADAPTSGKIVRIGPADDAADTAADGAPADVVVESLAPKHWIGILCGPVGDELRAQIDLPDNQGLLVRQIVPGSPADKAGIKTFDILITANDEKLFDSTQLTDLVRTEGAAGKTITLDVLRRGAHQSIELTPEARPDVPSVGSRMQTPSAPGPQAWHLDPRDPLARGFGGMPGPRTMPGMGFAPTPRMPNGVSVSVTQREGGPAHIKVKRGNDTWDIVGDDPSSLAQLPDDLRPFVEQLLSGALTGQLPAMAQMPMPQMSGRRGPTGFRPGELQQRLDLMQQQLEELQQRMRSDVESMGADGGQIVPDPSPPTQ